MKILVTGGYGLVGRSLQKIVKLQNVIEHDFVFLSSKDGDLRDVYAVDYLFKEHLPDIVVHLASCVGGVYENMSNNYRYLVDNLRINTNVVDACNRFGVKRLISCLSTCIFPDRGIAYPLTSDQLHNGLPHNSNIGYAYSKRILHLAGDLLTKGGSDITVINLTPTNLYGDFDNYNLKSSHVIPGLIHKTYIAKKSNTDLTVYGTGNALRQFLYVDDLSRVILRFVDYQHKEADKERSISCIVSPAESSEVSIRSLVETISKTFNFTGEIIYDTSYSDGQYKKTATDSELMYYFPDFEFTTLDLGLRETIDYFQKNYDKVRK
jgi:GDP-L-fucose synthase